MKVIAKTKYQEFKVKEVDLGRVPEEKEEWETTKEHAEFLVENGYVEIVEEKEVDLGRVPEEKEEKTKKVKKEK